MNPTCTKIEPSVASPTLPDEDPPDGECECCGGNLPYDENLWAEGYDKGVCRECYDGIVVTCQLSGEDDVMPSDVSPFIVLKHEFAKTARLPPGIYRVLSRPFYYASMLGGGFLSVGSVRFVAPLPRPDHTFEISGNICRKAAEPYRKAYRRVYGTKAWGRNAHGRHLDKIERAHIRATILANPNMLRDLEETPDKHGYWADLKDAYDLPDGLPTYHEWLAVEHKGVKVFFSCRDCWDSWFTVSPLPNNRMCRGEARFTFAASSLPTWQNDGQESYYRNHKACSTKAIIAAIDAGILTQDGCRDSASKATFYG